MREVKQVIEDYYNAWTKGLESKEGEGIKSYLSNDFQGYFGQSGLEEAYTYDITLDIEGVLSQYDEAEKRFEIFSIKERGQGNEVVVLGTECNIIQGVPHKASSMLIWRKEEAGWKLLREYIELER